MHRGKQYIEGKEKEGKNKTKRSNHNKKIK
jgi:hypothetical protein